MDGVLMVKRLRTAVGGVEVGSDNPAYPPRVVPAREIEVIGRVAWLSRAI
jgi:phage repressor protein C with HTH and peptisase S24 domain